MNAAGNLQIDLSLTAEIRLYYDLYLPENTTGKLPLLVAVHGYGAHKRHMMREAQMIAPDNFAIAAIQAPHQHFRQAEGGYRVGFGWLTDYKSEESVALHHKFVLQVIEKLAGDGAIDEARIFLYGFSQACALNFRFAFTYPKLLRGVIGACGGIPGDLETNENYQPTAADVFYLHSTEDEFYSPEKYRDFDRKLKDFLPNYQSRRYEAKHEITDEMRRDMRDWLKLRR